ncbi:MAG: RimK family alpha-L-glutamate ligase [Frankiaceae bacterium]
MSRRLAVVGGAVDDPIDAPILLPALADAGWDASARSWHDSSVDWSAFDVVLLRSCWDYVDDPAGFLDWLDAVGTTTTVLNHPALVRWNVDKSYLVDLAADGVPIVPSAVVTTAADVALPSVRFVVKPAVGGGSRLVQLFAPDEVSAATAHLARLTDGDGRAVVQPFLPPLDGNVGETNVYVIGGDVTHAVTKSQVLADGAAAAEDFRLAVEQEVRPAPVRSEHRRLALDVVAAVERRHLRPLYARVDLIDTGDGPLVLEVELIEPVLFLDRNPQALPSFVSALSSSDSP